MTPQQRNYTFVLIEAEAEMKKAQERLYEAVSAAKWLRARLGMSVENMPFSPSAEDYAI